MIKLSRLTALCAASALVGALATFTMTSSTTPVEAKDDAFKDKIRQVLVENPEIVIDALNAFEAQRDEREKMALREAIQANGDKIRQTPGIHILGNPDGKVMMVEFFDYHCGFCKSAMPSVMAMIEDNPELGVAFVEFPILSQDSETAARAALAAGEQGMYGEMHRALMEADGRLNLERVVALAKGIKGLDVAKMKKDMNSARTDSILDAHQQLAATLRIDGTPAFIVGDEPVSGWREDEVMRLIDEQMEKQG